jgi:hypothetical protein
MFFQHGNFYIRLNDRHILRIPDEDSKNYHNMNEIDFINCYVKYYRQKYNTLPMLYMSFEGNIVLFNRILTSEGIDYFKDYK